MEDSVYKKKYMVYNQSKRVRNDIRGRSVERLKLENGRRLVRLMRVKMASGIFKCICKLKSEHESK